MTDEGIRLTQPALKVLRLLLEKPLEQMSGAQISIATKVGAGTLYPMLLRMERAGWLTGEWEEIDPSEAGRPKRHLYRLTGVGHRTARNALAELQIPHGDFIWSSSPS
jgi:DNA-binding PadR family transcriptional regulator